MELLLTDLFKKSTRGGSKVAPPQPKLGSETHTNQIILRRKLLFQETFSTGKNAWFLVKKMRAFGFSCCRSSVECSCICTLGCGTLIDDASRIVCIRV